MPRDIHSHLKKSCSQKSNPRFHGVNVSCTGSCQVLFWQISLQDFPWLGFALVSPPGECSSRWSMSHSTLEASACSLPAFMPKFTHMKTRGRFDFQSVSLRNYNISCWESDRLRFAERPVCTFWSLYYYQKIGPGYHVQDISKVWKNAKLESCSLEHTPVRHRFGHKLGILRMCI